MTKLEKRYIFAKKLSALIYLADAHEIRIAPFAMFRTEAEQHQLYLEGKSNCDGRIKKSAHQFWLACDLGILKDDGTDFLWNSPKYAKIGELANKLGLIWGGSWDAEKNGFSDPYHVEFKDEINAI